MAARVRFLILAVVGVFITAAVTTTFAGSALGYAVFLGSGLLAGLGTAWAIARTTTGHLWLFAGAILVTNRGLRRAARTIGLRWIEIAGAVGRGRHSLQ